MAKQLGSTLVPAMMAAGHLYETELEENGAQHGDALAYPLHCAVFEGRHMDVKALLRTRREQGGDDGVRTLVEELDRTGDTPLLSASQPAETVSKDAYLLCVTTLVMAGADTSYTHQRWQSNAVHYAAGATQDEPRVVGLLLAAHERAGRSCTDLLDARNTKRHTPHDSARAKGNARTAELLESVRRSPHEALAPFVAQLGIEEGDPPEPEPEPEPDLVRPTFGGSNFKREYDATVPIEMAAQIIGEIPRFLHTYCRTHHLVSELHKAATSRFATELAQEVGSHPQGGAGNLLAKVEHTSELLWTSQKTFRGMEEHNKEFCSLLNRALREDDPVLAPSVATLSRGINSMCVEGRGEAALPFPPGGVTYRGGGFDDTFREFFSIGKQFRQPCFLATSFREAAARHFLRMARAYGQQGVLWVIRVDPAGEHDRSRRCKHVNFVAHSLIVDAAGNPTEQEYLFAAYSIFTVHSVTWGEGGVPHRIELDAASDNNPGAEGGEGRWATPVGSEELPLAPWA
eukprot:COSAG02_NODE_607_length_19608_cov_33.568968_6_plen_516_part_00